MVSQSLPAREIAKRKLHIHALVGQYPTIFANLNSSPVMLYALVEGSREATNYSFRLASDLGVEGYTIVDHVYAHTKQDPNRSGGRKIQNVYKPHVDKHHVLLVVDDPERARDGMYYWARKIRKLETETPEKRAVNRGAHVITIEPFSIATTQEIYRERFGETRKQEEQTDPPHMKLLDVGYRTYKDILGAGEEILDFLGDDGVILELDDDVYPAIGVGLYALEKGKRPPYLFTQSSALETIGDESELRDLEDKNVLVVTKNDDLDLEPFQFDLRVQDVRLLSSFGVGEDVYD